MIHLLTKQSQTEKVSVIIWLSLGRRGCVRAHWSGKFQWRDFLSINVAILNK
jgi:hypothetical protein